MVDCDPITYRESTTGETFSCGDMVKITLWELAVGEYYGLDGLILIGTIEHLYEDRFTLFDDEGARIIYIDNIELMEKVVD